MWFFLAFIRNRLIMAIVNQENMHENWFDALALWNRIANWIHYRTSETELRRQIKQMLVLLWNEKDWLKQQYPTKAKRIEEFIDVSKYISVVGDLANTVKHRTLTKKTRSAARQTNYYGKITLGNGVGRRLHYIEMGSGEHEEIMAILRGALDEFEELRCALLSGK